MAAAPAGNRFYLQQTGYKGWTAFWNNFKLGDQDTTPGNIERVSVFETISGRETFRLEYDPCPHIDSTTAALAPNGHRKDFEEAAPHDVP